MVELALAIMLARAGDDAVVVRELTAIEQQLAATWQAHDCDGWGALLDDGWSVIHTEAQTITKAEALQMCRARAAADPVGVRMDDIHVRVFGDAAVVTGRTTATSGTDAQTVALRFTDVFVRRDGRWLVVASHATRVP